MGAGLMHTGYYFGFFFAAVANYFIGATYGWRWMFIFGGLPALHGHLHSLRRARVEEVAGEVRRVAGEAPDDGAGVRGAVHPALQARHDRHVRAVPVSIIMLWAGSVYVPTAARQMAAAAGETVEANLARVATYASVVLAVATIIGCVLVPIIAERIGRRLTMGLFMGVLGVRPPSVSGTCSTCRATDPFMVLTFFMGLGGANFAMYTVWLPEQYTTDCRASAIGFISSVGRFVGVAMVFLVVDAIPSYGSLGVPVALTRSTSSSGCSCCRSPGRRGAGAADVEGTSWRYRSMVKAVV